jgi:tRNA(adenine34) deaminase
MGQDTEFMRQAIQLAQLAEREGNLPVGAVIALGDKVVAEGRSAIWVPRFDATRHAEVEALRAVPAELWGESQHMSLYTTLEPCLMCFASILLHRIGRVVFGASDPYGGAGAALGRLPPYFRERFDQTRWVGPILPADCDPLYGRLMTLVMAREGRERSDDPQPPAGA